jgi:hypothetical protein
MDRHDIGVFLLIAVICGAIYYFGFHRSSTRKPKFDVPNSPTVSYTPMGVPGGK